MVVLDDVFVLGSHASGLGCGLEGCGAIGTELCAFPFDRDRYLTPNFGLPPSSADRPPEELVRAELRAAFLALDLERRGKPRVALGAARDKGGRALRADRLPLGFVVLEVACDVTAARTKRHPVAERPAPFLLNPVALRLGHSCNFYPLAESRYARRASG